MNGATVDLEVVDYQGREWPLEAVPRKPILKLHLDRALSFVASGGKATLIDGSLTHDQYRKVQTDQSFVRLTNAIDLAYDDHPKILSLVPQQVLIRGATYTLLLLAPSLPRTDMSLVTITLVVSNKPDAGAEVIETWPANGAMAIGTNLPYIDARFDGALQPQKLEFVLQHRDRFETVAAQLTDCRELGWEDGVCIRAHPPQLEPSSVYQLTFSSQTRDSTGATLHSTPVTWTTAAQADNTAPALEPLECFADEKTIEGGCLSVYDHELSLRFVALEGVSAVMTAGGDTSYIRSGHGDGTLYLGNLQANTDARVHVLWRDTSGNPSSSEFRVKTKPALPTVAIMEACSNPLGPEPDQEYLELYNYGTTDVSLQGFTLADSLSAKGKALGSSFVLAAKSRLLIVAQNFNPQHPAEPGVQPGVAFLRVEGDLTTSGLSNAGETVILRDAAGQRVSAATLLPSTQAGRCLQRRSDVAIRAWERSHFDESKGGQCSPGFP